ncbi:MAG: hypothetical protein AAF842_03610 [Planctomycetota bacterium]
MSTIRLACPRCQTALELDAAFAGSVARCGQCQAMIAVPTEPQQAAATTAKPAPRRKKSTPWLLAGLITGVGAALILGGGVLVLANRDDPNAIDTNEAITDTLGYDPSVNPFTLRTPNALGVPLKRGAVVVIDASASARDWLPAAVAQVANATEGDRATGWIATESAVETIDASSVPVAAGLANASAASQRVAGLSPSMVVWVSGEPLAPDAEDRLAELDVPVSLILIDRDDFAAEALAEDSGGRYVELDSGQVLDWQRAAGR